MGLVTQDDGWRVPDELWAKMQPLLPPRSLSEYPTVGGEPEGCCPRWFFRGEASSG